MPRRAPNLTLARGFAVSGLAAAERPVLAGVRHLVTIGVCPRPGSIERPALGGCRLSAQHGMVGTAVWWSAGPCRRSGRVCCGVRVGHRWRWGEAWGLLLRERSCVRHDQVLKWTGMRPLVRIDRTGLYHRGCSVSRWHCGVAPRRLRSCADCLSVGRVDRWSALRVSGSRDGPRRAGRRSQPRQARQAASHPLLRCLDIDLAHGGVAA